MGSNGWRLVCLFVTHSSANGTCTVDPKLLGQGLRKRILYPEVVIVLDNDNLERLVSEFLKGMDPCRTPMIERFFERDQIIQYTLSKDQSPALLGISLETASQLFSDIELECGSVVQLSYCGLTLTNHRIISAREMAAAAK